MEDDNGFESIVRLHADSLDRLIRMIERHFGSTLVRGVLYELFMRLEARNEPSFQVRTLQIDRNIMRSIDCELDLLRKVSRAVDIYLNHNPSTSDRPSSSGGGGDGGGGGVVVGGQNARDDLPSTSNPNRHRITLCKEAMELRQYVASVSTVAANEIIAGLIEQPRRLEAQGPIVRQAPPPPAPPNQPNQANLPDGGENNDENLEGAAALMPPPPPPPQIQLTPAERQYLEGTFICPSERIMQIIAQHLSNNETYRRYRSNAYLQMVDHLRDLRRDVSPALQQSSDEEDLEAVNLPNRDEPVVQGEQQQQQQPPLVNGHVLNGEDLNAAAAVEQELPVRINGDEQQQQRQQQQQPLQNGYRNRSDEEGNNSE